MISKNNIFQKKSILVSLAGILLAVFMGLGILKNYRDLRDALINSEQEHLLTIADTAAKNIEAYFESEKRALDILIQDLKFQREFEILLNKGSNLEANNALQMYYKIVFPRIDSVQLLNLEGEIINQYPKPFNKTNTSNIKDEVKIVISTNDTIVSRVYFENKKSYINILKPITINNTLKGIISCKLNVTHIYNTFIKPIKSGNKGYASAKDNSGVFIMHPSKDEIGKNVLNVRNERFPDYDWSELTALFKKQMSGEKGVEIYHSVWITDKKPTRTKKFNGYAPSFVSDNFWIVTVSADYNEVVSVIKKNYYFTVIIAFLIVGIIISSIVYTYIIREKKKKLEIKSMYLNEVKILNKELEEDIKQRKILEVELKKKLRENREKEVMLISQSRYAAMGEMIANIAHQWRQPLSTLALILSNIEDSLRFNDLSEEDLKKLFIKSKLIINKMSETIEDFKDFFNPKTNRELFSIYRSIESTIELTSERLKLNSIELAISHENDIKITGYENQLSQVILNIINNAIDALKDSHNKNKIIDIKIYSEFIKGEIKAVIEIQDNAGGIEEDIQHKVFEPYFSTKNKKNGTGLGLYMSKMIIEKNFNGDIEVYNKYGGACFKLYFPEYRGVKSNELN